MHSRPNFELFFDKAPDPDFFRALKVNVFHLPRSGKPQQGNMWIFPCVYQPVLSHLYEENLKTLNCYSLTVIYCAQISTF